MNDKTKKIVFSVILVILSLVSIKNVFLLSRKGGRLEEAYKEKQNAQKELESIKNEIEFRQSSEFIEQEARNKLNLGKSGETVFIKPNIITQTNDMNSTKESSENTTFIHKIGLFFKKLL